VAEAFHLAASGKPPVMSSRLTNFLSA
jgi:hypothetical protein